MQTPREPEIERQLGATEDMYWRFDSVSPLNFGTVVGLKGRLDIEHLRQALKSLQLRHPLLRVKVQCDLSGNPWFRSGVGMIPLNVLNQPQGDEWNLLERQLSTPFDTLQGPLMRCVLIRHSEDDCTLISTYHHSVCDGKSAIFLMRDIFQSLAQQQAGESAELVPLPLMEYYGDRIPKLESYVTAEGLKTAWKTVQASANFMSKIGLPMGIRKTGDDVPLEKQSLFVEPRIIEPELMKRIAKKAKAEHVTVQCVLNAALSLAVADDSPPNVLQATSSTQVLDIRERLIPPVGENCGCFVSGATSLHHLNKSSKFWPLARSIREGLQDNLETPLPFFHPAMHKSFAQLGRSMGKAGMKMFSEIIGKLHPEGLSVSNLGQVTIEVDNCPVEITRFGFATNTNVLNYFNTSAATYQGRMTWSFSGSSMLTRKRVAKIADRAIERVMEALEN